MSEDNAFKKILLGNTWQENLNIWKFQDRTIEITQFTNPKYIKSFEYSIDTALDGRFIIATPKAVFGHVLATVNLQNPHPKMIFECDRFERRFLELEAYQGFTIQETKLVEDLITGIRTKFQARQHDLASVSHKQDRGMRTIALKIETLEIVVKSTIRLATNFRVYYENLASDVSKIEKELNLIK